MIDLFTTLPHKLGWPLFIFYSGHILGLFYFVFYSFRVFRSVYWPFVYGKLLKCKVVKKSVPNQSSGTRVNSLSIEYEYEVMGKQYVGSRFRFFNAESSVHRGHLDEFVNSHTKGGFVKIYYHPRKPYISTIQPGISGGVGLWFCTLFWH